jgi:hypothetical protein
MAYPTTMRCGTGGGTMAAILRVRAYGRLGVFPVWTSLEYLLLF